KIFEGRYEQKHMLGKGNFGEVWLAVEKSTKKQVAVKVLKKKNFKTEDQIKHAQNEMEICKGFVKSLGHKNIVKVYEVDSDSDYIYIVMECVKGGELFDKIKKYGRIKEIDVQKWFRQLIEAMEYIHKNGIVHRDLKPENVLLDEFNNIRVCDFGFGKKCKELELLEIYCGSPYYAAPEMVSSTPYRGPPADMWSCGVMLFAMLTGHLPFHSSNPSELFRKIRTGPYSLPRYVSAEASQLIAMLLVKDPDARMTANECLGHPW
ncbi:kinase-like domain-containing protein, partial [Phycomyces blakesleeanus]